MALTARHSEQRWILKSGNLVEVATNLDGEYANRVCCIIAVRGSLLREDKATAAALTRAVLEAQG